MKIFFCALTFSSYKIRHIELNSDCREAEILGDNCHDVVFLNACLFEALQAGPGGYGGPFRRLVLVEICCRNMPNEKR